MKGTTNTNITPHSDELSMTKRLYKPLVDVQQPEKAIPMEKPIPEGYVTLEVFMTNLLNAIDQHYARKKDNY